MRADVESAVPGTGAETSWGTPSVDIGRGVRAQLEAEEVEVLDVSRCTLEDDDLYSYRRQGEHSGRLAGLVWVRP
jgi:copper oxidase (laccase) domain-containing protein